MLELSCLKVAVADHVATVTLARPPVNAINRAFREEVIRVFDRLDAEPEVRAILLTGEGRTFSAGADLKERPAIAEELGAYTAHNRLTRESFNAILECVKPVVVAVNGAAIGAGCALALCGDILIAAEPAYFAMTEVDVGLAGGVRFALRHFNQSDARLMILTARRIPAAELLRMNVISACVAPDQLLPVALGIAQEIAAKSPHAVQAAKRSFQMTEEMPLKDGYRYEQTQTAALSKLEDTREAQRAFAEKRKPVFTGR